MTADETAARVLSVLRHHAAGDRICPTNAELAALLGASHTACSEAIRSLERADVIAVGRSARSRTVILDGVELRSAWQAGRPPQPGAPWNEKMKRQRARALQEALIQRNMLKVVPVAVEKPPHPTLTGRICGDPVAPIVKPAGAPEYRPIPRETYIERAFWAWAGK